jgi:hypothetical protein
MWLILLIWGIIAAIMGLAMYGAANSSTHEVQGAIWLLIATVSITGAFVLRAMDLPKKKG